MHVQPSATRTGDTGWRLPGVGDKRPSTQIDRIRRRAARHAERGDYVTLTVLLARDEQRIGEAEPAHETGRGVDQRLAAV
jgi:hypothetical protein